MKNYKLLVPFVLVVLFAASVYMIFDSNGKIENKYNDHLTAARSYAEQGILVDAIENYTLALEIKNTYELKMEIARFYLNSKQIDEASAWCQEVVKDYPKEVEAYKYLMDIYFQTEDYTACFQLSDAMDKRKLPKESVGETLAAIHNLYYLHGQYENVTAFGGGFCAVQTKGSWGFVNEKGEKVIATKFNSVGSFREELAPVVDSENDVYFIDTEGNKKRAVVGVEKTKKLGSIEDEKYTLFDGETWGLYGNDDKLIVDGFEDASVFTNGIVAFKNDGMWGLYGADGKETTPDKYDHVVQDDKGIVFRNNRLFVRINGQYYLIDQSGKKIIETAFEDTRLFNDNSYAAVKINGKWGYIDSDGKYFIDPSYADARSFSAGFAAVYIDGKWGFIDESKELALVNIFSEVKDFNEHGSVFVSNGDEWELLKLYRLNH
jgi:hypothetical protein